MSVTVLRPLMERIGVRDLPLVRSRRTFHDELSVITGWRTSTRELVPDGLPRFRAQ